MTIRYECDECGSVLKIKDDRAGTDGKCPKCKKKFIVPEPNEPSPEDAEAPAPKKKKPASAATKDKAPAQKPAEKPQPAEKPEAEKKPAENEDDFDLDAFLMEDGPVKAKEPEPKAGAGGGRKTPSGRKRVVPTMDDDAPQDMSPAAASAASAASAAMGASANAKDLLGQTAEASRIKASSIPEDDRGPAIDYSMFRAQLMQALPYAVGVVVAVGLLYWLMSSMLATKVDVPPLAHVSGTVTLDGKPMTDYIVNLTPVFNTFKTDGGDEIKVATASGVTDENGYFELIYIEGYPGAPIGKGRIWLSSTTATGAMKIPPQHATSATTDIREVREAGNKGNFDLELTSGKAAGE